MKTTKKLETFGNSDESLYHKLVVQKFTDDFITKVIHVPLNFSNCKLMM